MLDVVPVMVVGAMMRMARRRIRRIREQKQARDDGCHENFSH
jgi:hypothetical protein